MKSAGKARSNGLYRHIRTSKEIIRNLLNDYNIVNILMHRYDTDVRCNHPLSGRKKLLYVFTIVECVICSEF